VAPAAEKSAEPKKLCGRATTARISIGDGGQQAGGGGREIGRESDGG
jgi:hypothetical protein